MSEVNEPKWFKVFATIISLLTLCLGVVTMNQNDRLNTQQNQLQQQKQELDKQQLQLNQAKQRIDFKIQLYDKAFSSLQQKNVQQQQALLALLNSLGDEIDKEFVQKLVSIITYKSLDPETKFQGLLLQFDNLINGKEIIYRPGSPSNYNFTDFDIFVCKVALQDNKKTNTLTLLDSLLRVFDKTERVGRIRIKLWENYRELSDDQLKNQITIITDKGHPEKKEGERIITEIKNAQIPNLPKITSYDNASKASPWLVSVVLCP